MADIEVGDYVEYHISNKLCHGIVRGKHPVTNVLTKKIIKYEFDVEQLGEFNVPDGTMSSRYDDELVKKDPPKIDQAAFDAWMRSKDPARRRMDEGLRSVFGGKKPKDNVPQKRSTRAEDDIDTEPDGAPVTSEDDDHLSIMFPDGDFWSFMKDWNN